MALDETSLVPLYQQIIADIKTKISVGAFAEGDRIPSEAELADTYGVSRITVRRSVEELSQAGYLVKRQGKGTFVAPRPVLRRLVQETDVQSFTDVCTVNGVKPGAVLISCAVEKAPADVADYLNLEEGAPVIVVKRLRTADGLPIMFETNSFPLRGHEFLLEANLTNNSIFGLVGEQTGRYPTESDSCTLTVVRASEKTAEVMDVPVGEPLFFEMVCLADQAGEPLLVGKQRIIGSRYAFNI